MCDSVSEKEIKEIRDDIMVTVICVTYNHEKYLRGCLESIVNQKTNFKFQVFIGEDCSTDSTREIVKEFEEKYPDIIVPFYRENNIGSIRNFGDLCERVDTKYVAFCDGDDYWIDYNKLQKQVDLLEANPELKGVCARLRLDVPEDWFLMDFYKKNQDGNFYFPDCLPGFNMPNNKLVDINHMISNNIVHPCAAMIRINQDIIKLPSWFYDSYIGDLPYFLMQIGIGKIQFTDDVIGICRKHDGGVTHSYDFETNMLNTRTAYITYLMGVREFFIENYRSYGLVNIENRIKLEVSNYLAVLVKYEMDDKILELFQKYPEASRIALKAYLSFYWDSRKMTRIYTWNGNVLVARNSKFMHLLSPIVRMVSKLKEIKQKFKRSIFINKCKKLLKKCSNLLGLIIYWVASIIPKQKNLWVFTSFKQKGYLDNSKYFYEYVSENHSEINSIWLTKDKSIYKKLKDNGKNVYLSTSIRGIWKMMRANIAVTDHYRITDYPCTLGFNNKTKVVQLWHGVGFKSMGNEEKVNVGFEGVQYSKDILCNNEDGFKERVIKGYKYFRHAFFRELFEQYFLFVCPGQERIDMIGSVWGIPKDRYFMAGHPRDIYLYNEDGKIGKSDKVKILYAPTYRQSKENEEELIEMLLSNIENISNFIEKFNGEFYIRLHPYTWRNYNIRIKKAIRAYNNVFLDDSKDIYENIKQYSVLVSDYSSITIDFAGIIKRPVVYLCYDYDVFNNSEEMGFNLDYFKNTPGPKTYTWDETMKEVEQYIENPQKDSEMRKEICKYFFDEDANGIDNSERITNEIKRRLNIK